jgi:pSer/pThr/pTyr-binding forkhead associated (FHA) protein/soluble lytic murein transglycosylase-like protein
MVELTVLTGRHQGTRLRLEGPVVRIGRADDCHLRLEDRPDSTVSSHHAELVVEDDGWVLIDTGSTNGSSLNGVRVVKQRVKPGDLLVFGGQDGVGVRVESIAPARRAATPAPDPRPATRALPSWGAPRAAEATGRVGVMTDASVAAVTGEAAQRVVAERAKTGGKSSGLTIDIMAAAVAEMGRTAKARSGRRWLKLVAAVGAAGLVVAGAMGVVIWRQHQVIEALVSRKTALDREIELVQKAMEREPDERRLGELEQQLARLTGTALTTIEEVASQDRARAEELKDEGDDLDRAIRAILTKFDAHTYAVPPVFKETLQREVEVLARSANLKFVFGRRNRYWPSITETFSRLGLPEEMAYIAWAETQFDPAQVSPSGARGMWQMTAATAQELGLRVDETVDERLDVPKQTQAAARKLADLLSVFGSDSFMLAMASYNSGEAGVRRVLLQVAREKDGFRKDKRDFWHLYRLRRLPQETMDYVPRVLAAAVVCGNPRKYGLEPTAPR